MTARQAIAADDIRSLIRERYAVLAGALQATERSATATRVHRTRVAARGLRALLGTLGPCLGTRARARAMRDLRNLAAELGERREADVRREWLRRLAESSGALAPGAHQRLVAELEADCRRASHRLRRHLASEAYRERLARLEETLRAPGLVKGRAIAVEVLQRRLRRRWKKVRRRLHHVAGDPDALHRLRITVKKARYASDALAPLLGMERLPAQGQLKGLQDALGEHRDATESLEWLAGLGEPLGPVLAARLAAPIQRVRARRLKQVERMATRFELPALEASRAVRPARGSRPPAGGGSARRAGGRRGASR